MANQIPARLMVSPRRRSNEVPVGNSGHQDVSVPHYQHGLKKRNR